MPVSSRNGWGAQTAFFPATQDSAGARTVLANVGIAAQIIAGKSPIQLAKISWRVDLAPDVAVGTVISPTRWRLVVFAGQLPTDVSTFQAQRFPAGSHPEIPAITSENAPVTILWDEWLDFAAGDPGLNAIASESWGDVGPGVGPKEVMTILLVPILDATLSQALPGAANALAYLAVAGGGVSVDQTLANGGGTGGSRSLPRFDVSLGG